MKKILLATTVLGMTAGFAAADVSVSGDGRMGIKSTDGASVFSNRMRIKFSGSGTTDAGLSFGGSFRAKDASGADSGTSGSVFLSGAFGKITMGDVGGGDSESVGQLASVGYTGLGSGNSINYSSDGFDGFALYSTGTGSAYNDNVGDAGGAKVLYTYSASGLTVNVSTAQLSNTATDHTAYGVGASYTSGALTVAVGYGNTDISVGNYFGITNASSPLITDALTLEGSVTDTSASAAYVMGATTIKAIYQDKELEVSRAATGTAGQVGSISAISKTLSATSMGVSVSHKIDAVTLTGYTVSTDISTNLATTDATVTRSGIGASYDLGGGASLAAGYATYDVPALAANTVSSGSLVGKPLTTTSVNVFDVGVNFSF